MREMLAAVIHEHGDRDVLRLEQVPIPQPSAGEARLKVHACALNWLDVGIRKGPQFGAIPLPMTTGVDISGELDAVGEGVSGWQAGDEATVYSLVTCGDCEFCREGDVTVCPQHQIIGEHINGGLAEYVVVPARNLIPKPKNLNHIEVAALLVVAGTAWRMLITVASLKAGETVFIPGAGGGVASLGIQIAKYAGARVIASTSTIPLLPSVYGPNPSSTRLLSSFSRTVSPLPSLTSAPRPNCGTGIPVISSEMKMAGTR